MAETFGDVKSFSKQLSQREIDEGRVYIKESYATTLFGYPSNARRDVEVYLMSHSNSKKIRLCKDGDKYYFNQGWSQFASLNRLRAGYTITLTKIEPRRTDQKKEFMFGVTKN